MCEFTSAPSGAEVFITKFEVHEDIVRILGFNKTITLPSFVEVEPEGYSHTGNNTIDSTNKMRTVGWGISEIGLNHY